VKKKGLPAGKKTEKRTGLLSHPRQKSSYKVKQKAAYADNASQVIMPNKKRYRTRHLSGGLEEKKGKQLFRSARKKTPQKKLMAIGEGKTSKDNKGPAFREGPPPAKGL